jgi:hypothetical protein
MLKQLLSNKLSASAGKKRVLGTVVSKQMLVDGNIALNFGILCCANFR